MKIKEIQSIDDCYIISGYVDHDHINELQRFILRFGSKYIGIQPLFTTPSKHCCSGCIGSFFCFLFNGKPTKEDMFKLRKICDIHSNDIVYEKWSNQDIYLNHIVDYLN